MSPPVPHDPVQQLGPHSDAPPRALSLVESRSTTPRTPRKSQKTLERFLEFIEQKKAGEEWEGELEGEVVNMFLSLILRPKLEHLTLWRCLSYVYVCT